MKRLSSILLSALCLAVGAGTAAAQDKYPSKPVKIIVPYAPGGATDIVSRILGEQLRVILGQSFVTENKPGAFGIVGIEEMARARPDGHTLFIGNVTTNAITPIVHATKFSISYEKDVVPVARLVDIPAFIVVSTKDFAPKTLAEVIALAKQNKGKVRYGHVGVGSYPHYDTEVFSRRAGIEMNAIPNKAGASGVLKDMATGDVQVSFLNVASSGPMIKAGQIKPVALINPTRLPEYPDVPTMAELGFKDVGTMAWQSMLAPAGTPKEVLETLNKAILQAMESPQVKDAFGKQYFNIVPTRSVDEAKAFLEQEIALWKKTTDEIKIDLAE
jgi:tripartite-type tricarboxylate transporter receptor subunit TctC